MTICACGRPVTDAFLCPDCTIDLGRSLAELATLVGVLGETYARRDVLGGSYGNDSHPMKFKTQPLLYRERAAQLRAQTRRAVRIWTWALLTRVPSAVAPASVSGRCTWLAAHAGELAQVPEAKRWVEQAAGLCSAILTEVDHPPTPVYLGPCDECAQPMYAQRGDAVHVCASARCARTYDVAVRLALLLDRSRLIVASPAMIATALTSLDQPVTEERIWKWRQRGKLTPRKIVRGVANVGDQAWYRVGDVIDLLEAERARGRARVSGPKVSPRRD